MPMADAAAATIGLVVSVLLVGLVRQYARHGPLIDQPNLRSSHLLPTPRGGGLGLIVAFVATFAIAAAPALENWRLTLGLVGLLLTAAVGWRDDHGGLRIRTRLAAHVVAGACLLPMALWPDPVPGWLGYGVVVWWLFWAVSAINVVNFMDGIDGIIGLQALVFGVHMVLLGGDTGPARAYGLSLAGASLGFLIWNWAPAKIFLGDVGSGALGFALVFGGLLLMRGGSAGLIVAYLPLYPIFLDAAQTLVRRARRGEQLTAAHRDHLYQRLANGGWGHARVGALYGTASLIAVGVAHVPQQIQSATLVTYFVLLPMLGWALERTQQCPRELDGGWPPRPTP